MNYEATQCAVCRRPLVDAVSVELGIGPDCRKKHGFDIACDTYTRNEANMTVHQIAMGAEGPTLHWAIGYLKHLGFEKLALRIAKRLVSVEIEEKNGRLYIDAPFKAEALQAFRTLPGRRFDVPSKRWSIPTTIEAKRAAWTLLKMHYAGAVGLCATGPFFIPSERR